MSKYKFDMTPIFGVSPYEMVWMPAILSVSRVFSHTLSLMRCELCVLEMGRYIEIIAIYRYRIVSAFLMSVFHYIASDRSQMKYRSFFS